MEYTVSSSYFKMMTDAGKIRDESSAQAVLARSEFIFTTAAVTLLAGLLVPVPVRLLDVLWVLSVCLAGAVVLISFMAKESGELSSFPLLLLTGSWLRIALAAASARLIFLRGAGGAVIEGIGQILGTVNQIWAFIITPVAAIVAGLLVYSATRRIVSVSLSFAFDTMPLKKISIDTELNAGIIDKDKAAVLKARIASEAQFYLNMAGVTKLLRCDVGIAALVVIVLVAGQIAITAIGRMSTSSDIFTQTYMSLGTGVGILALVPAVLTAAASAKLLDKSSLSLGQGAVQKEQSRTIKIVSQETGRSEEVELLNPDFVKANRMGRQAAHPTDFARVGQQQSGVIKTGPCEENIASFEPAGTVEAQIAQNLRVTEKFNSIEDYYDDLAHRIENLPSEHKTILFAAESTEELPVTVAVNVAIMISNKDKRCLLIDSDTERNAIAKVFELESSQIRSTAVETCIKNLSVLSDPGIVGDDVGPAREKIQTILNDYDRVIIYAPNMNSASRIKVLSSMAGSAIIFEGSPSDNNLSRQIESSGCKLLAIMPANSKPHGQLP